jgi:tetraacyldisaccharide 4'-kinase
LLQFLSAPFLALFSFFYWMGLTFDRFIRSRERTKLPRPVISIGNLTMGGTGKTPLLIRLCRDLQERGLKPAILSRGYRGAGRPPAIGVFIGPVSAEEASDEAALLSEKLPNVPLGLGPDRAASARKILDGHQVDVFLLDDGFQHWRLKRDADLVTIDAIDPWGGGHMIPWGRLREPISALDRATAVVATRTELISEKQRDVLQGRLLSKIPNEKLIFSRFEPSLRLSTGEEQPLNVLQNRTVLAASGIGNPAAFEENLRRLGAQVIPRRFPDHYNYQESDVAALLKEASEKKAILVMTEKDAIKIKPTLQPFYVLEAPIDFHGAGRDRWVHLIHDLSKISLRG